MPRFLGCDAKPRLPLWRRWRPPRPRAPLLPPEGLAGRHCVLPLEYDFFADYKAIRQHVWFESTERRSGRDLRAPGGTALGNLSDMAWAVEQYLDTYAALGPEGVKVLHWPGELRKPWQRWHPAARSHWDELWWQAYHHMCQESAAPCRLQCT